MEELRGRTALVGTMAVGTGDAFTTPFAPVLPGVEALASAVGHLTRGDSLIRDGFVRGSTPPRRWRSRPEPSWSCSRPHLGSASRSSA